MKEHKRAGGAVLLLLPNLNYLFENMRQIAQQSIRRISRKLLMPKPECGIEEGAYAKSYEPAHRDQDANGFCQLACLIFQAALQSVSSQDRGALIYKSCLAIPALEPAAENWLKAMPPMRNALAGYASTQRNDCRFHG